MDAGVIVAPWYGVCWCYPIIVTFCGSGGGGGGACHRLRDYGRDLWWDVERKCPFGE